MSKGFGNAPKWLAVAACTVALAGTAWAQDFPSKRVSFIVPFAPGGPTDAVARVVGGELEKTWKQPVTIENKPGAAGYLGADYVVRQPPDGYTLLLHGSPAVFLAKIFMKDSPVDPTQLRPVVLVSETYQLLMAPAALGVKNLKEFVALAKTRGSAMNMGMVPGTHHEFELYNFMKMAGIQMTVIPYQSAAPEMQAGLRGDIDLFTGQFANVMPQVTAGALVPVAYGGPQRYRLAPNIPTAREQGFDTILGAWLGIIVHVKTPDDIVRKIAQDTAAGLKQPEAIQRMNAAGFDVPAAPLDWPKDLPQQIKTYTDLARAMNYQAK